MSFWGLSFDTLAKLYLHDSHRAMLTPLLGFKFNRIPSDILTDTKLDILESYIQQRRLILYVSSTKNTSILFILIYLNNAKEAVNK